MVVEDCPHANSSLRLEGTWCFTDLGGEDNLQYTCMLSLTGKLAAASVVRGDRSEKL